MNKKQIVINTHLYISVILFVAFLCLSIQCVYDNEIWLCIAFAALTLLPIFAFAISPLYFVFSDACVEIVYNFRQRELIQWSCVRHISLIGSWIGPGAWPRYEIAYPQRERKMFFVAGEIPKTRKTAKLINKYYKKKIERKKSFSTLFRA